MRYIISLITVATLAVASRASAELAFEKASAELQSATVTVRVIPSELAAPDDGDAIAKVELPPRSVEVCSGASLGDGLVVTYASISSQDEVRITIPGGEQANASLRVLDHVSGLTLLEIDKKDAAGFSVAKKAPGVGGWVLAGAGWGSEKPVVSFGILAGANRTLRGGTFPPLLQCDLRTADTSNGAPLVNQTGELIGIIVASDAAGSENRWTYAVPVDHVQRLVRARRPDKMIKLESIRPVVGLKLVPGDAPDTVFVGRVEKGGPADKAGLRPGDQVIAAEGVKIRSVYEVLRPLMAKQAGAKMNFTVEQDGNERSLDVVLGGGTVIQPAPQYANATGIADGGKVVIRQLGFAPQTIEIDRTQVRPAADTATLAKQLQKVETQQRAITGYLSALESMRRDLKQRDQQLQQRDAEIEALRQQLKQLQGTR